MIVFFDIDDTLVDHSRAMRAAAIGLHADRGMDVEVEEFISDWLEAHRRHYPRFLAGELSYEALRRMRIRETVSDDVQDEEADEIFATYMKIYRSEWTLFSDVVPCLDRLRGCTLGVISNGRSEEQRAKLCSLGIEDRFQHVLISEDCGFAKPSPQIFKLACQMAAASPDEVVFVGDHFEIDVLASRNAGLRGIWLNRLGRNSHAEHFDSVGSLIELADILQGGIANP
jgi:putative hydrolase of the HAD superfamily